MNDNMLNYKKAILLLVVAYAAYILANLVMGMEIADFMKKGLILVVCVLFLKVALSTSMEKLIILLVLMLPFPVYINFGKDLGTSITLAIYLVFFVEITRKMMRKEPPFPYRPLIAVLIYISVCYVISFSNTQWFGRENALRAMSIFGSCGMIFYMVVNSIQRKDSFLKIIDFISIMCFVESLLIIYQVIFPAHSGFINFFASRVIDVTERYAAMEAAKGGIRVIGTIATDYGLISVFFAMNIIIQFFRIQSLKQSIKKKLYVLCILFSCFALVSIGTRGGFIALFIGMLIILTMSKSYIKVGKNIVLICILSLFLFGFMFIVSENFPHVANLFERLTGTEFEGVMPDTRVNVWKIVWPIVMEHPWIGWGPQNIGKSGIEVYMNPHNMYLTYIFNIGFIGTLGIMVFFCLIFWYGLRAIKKIKDTEMVYATVGLMGSYVVFLLTGLIGEYLRSSSMQQFVWIIFALIVSVAKISKDGYDKDLKRID